jgi:hypothetical protein
MASRAHVLLERVEVADRLRVWDRRMELHGIEVDYLVRISTCRVTGCCETLTVIAEEAEQRDAGGAGVDAAVNQETRTLVRVLRMLEGHPPHGSAVASA